MAEYHAHLDRARELLERQARTEARLLTGEAAVAQEATCAPCLRRAVFATRRDPGQPPDWAHQAVCDCEDQLGGAARALLHAAPSVAGLRSWSRLLLFGPPLPVHRRLRGLAGETVALADLAGGRLAAPNGMFQVLVAADCLHRVPAFGTALTELRRVAAPGGTLLATLPFRHRVAVSASIGRGLRTPGMAREELHAVGWDILPMLRQVGWSHAEMLRVWSREFGYLGAHNFIIRAVA